MAASGIKGSRCRKCGRPYRSERRVVGVCPACISLLRTPAESRARPLEPGSPRVSRGHGLGAARQRTPVARAPVGLRARPSATLQLTVAQDDSFVETCLPQTMGLALRHRRRLSQEMRGLESSWPFTDRVLVWLDEFWQRDVKKYQEGASGAMTDLFRPHQLERLDEHYREHLRSRLEQSLGESISKPRKQLARRRLDLRSLPWFSRRLDSARPRGRE
jgi:hypothetical protein